jgi:hypothetical protein
MNQGFDRRKNFLGELGAMITGGVEPPGVLTHVSAVRLMDS